MSNYIIRNDKIVGKQIAHNKTASEVSYDSATSGLNATTVQSAIDETIAKKQDVLSASQLTAVNSEATKSKVEQIQTNRVDIAELKVNMNSALADIELKANADDVYNKSDVDTKFVKVTEKGINNGVATLDASGKIPQEQLNLSAENLRGMWDASTNTPTLQNSVGELGDTYICSAAGTVDFGAGEISFNEGDKVIYINSIWNRNVTPNAVASVNNKTGNVTITAEDIFTEEQLLKLENSITSSDIAEMSASVQANTANIANMQTEVAGLSTTITNTQAEVDTLENSKQDTLSVEQIDATNSGITAARLTNIETAITETSTEVETKLDKTTDVANAGKSVMVGADGQLTFDSIIDDTATSADSTWSSSNISDLTQYKRFTTSDSTQWIKLTLGSSTTNRPITVIDQYGGMIEILGMAYDGTYKSPKVVRYSYGDWQTYSATEYSVTSQGDANYKIRRFFYYPVDGCYYLEIRQWTDAKVFGCPTAELLETLPAESSEMTLIPESEYAAKKSLTSAAKQAQGGTPFYEIYSNETPYSKLTVDCYYSRPQTFIITASSGYYGKLFVVMNGSTLDNTTVKVITENGAAPFEIKYDNAQQLSGSGHYSVDIFIHKTNAAVVTLNIKPYIQGVERYTKLYTGDEFIAVTETDFTNATKTATISSQYATTYEMPTTRRLTLNTGYAGFITEMYDPVSKVVTYNVNINGTFKGLGNEIATGFKLPSTATSGADVMASTIGIYGAKNTSTGDAQFTRLLIRSYGNPFLDVDSVGDYEISGVITYVAA